MFNTNTCTRQSMYLSIHVNLVLLQFCSFLKFGICSLYFICVAKIYSKMSLLEYSFL